MSLIAMHFTNTSFCRSCTGAVSVTDTMSVNSSSSTITGISVAVSTFVLLSLIVAATVLVSLYLVRRKIAIRLTLDKSRLRQIKLTQNQAYVAAKRSLADGNQYSNTNDELYATVGEIQTSQNGSVTCTTPVSDYIHASTEGEYKLLHSSQLHHGGMTSSVDFEQIYEVMEEEEEGNSSIITHTMADQIYEAIEGEDDVNMHSQCGTATDKVYEIMDGEDNTIQQTSQHIHGTKTTSMDSDELYDTVEGEHNTTHTSQHDTTTTSMDSDQLYDAVDGENNYYY